MTAPRNVLEGQTYLVTRNCTQRQYLLRPGEVTNEVFDYCMAEAAARFGIGLIAWNAMSNHYHAVIHDRYGVMPAFIEHLHKLVAKTLNRAWDRRENFWASEQTCVTLLPTLQDIFAMVIYVLTNPVAAHLVDRAAQWPGSTSMGHLDGRVTQHPRPRLFFSANGAMPESVQLRVEQPLQSAAVESFEEWTARVREGVAKREETLAAERRRSGTRIFGRKACLRLSPFASPTTPAPKSDLRPTLACKDPVLREHLLRKLTEFRTMYRRALTLFVAGRRKVRFPAGTYRMRGFGVTCEAEAA